MSVEDKNQTGFSILSPSTWFTPSPQPAAAEEKKVETAAQPEAQPAAAQTTGGKAKKSNKKSKGGKAKKVKKSKKNQKK